MENILENANFEWNKSYNSVKHKIREAQIISSETKQIYDFIDKRLKNFISDKFISDYDNDSIHFILFNRKGDGDFFNLILQFTLNNKFNLYSMKSAMMSIRNEMLIASYNGGNNEKQKS